MKYILVFTFLVLSSAACQTERAPEAEKASINNKLSPADVEKETVLPKFETEFSYTFQNKIVSSCSQLNKMNKFSSQKKYSFLSYASFSQDKLNIDLGSSISENHFYKYFFANKFNFEKDYLIPTNEDFFDKIEKKCSDAKTISMENVKCQYLRYIAGCFDEPKTNQCTEIKFEVVLAEKFNKRMPGVTGKIERYPVDHKEAIPLFLLNKVTGQELIQQDDSFLSQLTKKTPLFFGNKWATAAANESNNLIAAVQSLQSKDPKERACGMIIWRRLFDQTLDLTGYNSVQLSTSPETQEERKLDDRDKKYIRQFLPKIRASQLGFTQYLNSPHVHIIDKLDKKVKMSLESFFSYDPSKEMMLFKELKGDSFSFNTQINFLRFNTTVLEATSPAAKWYNENNYVVGEFLNPTNKALVSREVHLASLGFIYMSFKNLEYNNIRFINAQGKAVSNKADAAGIIIGAQSKDDQNVYELNLKDIANFVKIYANLKELVNNTLNSESPLVNEMYDKSTIALITNFKTQLSELELPLSLLVKKLNSKNLCIEEMSWNLQTGETQATKTCSAETKKEAILSLNHLAKQLKSPILYEKLE